MIWYFHVLKRFSQLVLANKVKSFWLVKNGGVDAFLEFSRFFYDPIDLDDLISGSYAISRSSFNIWKFLFHILWKPGLENIECYFASMWDECNCEVVWTFFGIAFLWDWNENWWNSSRKNEEAEPKRKQYPVVDVTGDGSKVQCCKEQYCIGNWNVISMNQGK